MSWAEANAALQLLAEERLGTRVRKVRAQEDAAVGRMKRKVG